jgi:hypothetical protein
MESENKKMGKDFKKREENHAKEVEKCGKV